MQPIYSAQLLEGEQLSWSVQAAFIMRTIGLWIAVCLAVQLVVTWMLRLGWICATRNVASVDGDQGPRLFRSSPGAGRYCIFRFASLGTSLVKK
jgi:hypothetical protein